MSKVKFSYEQMFSIYRFDGEIMSVQPINYEKATVTHKLPAPHEISRRKKDQVDSLYYKCKGIYNKAMSDKNPSEWNTKESFANRIFNRWNEGSEVVFECEQANWLPSIGPLQHSIETKIVTVKLE